MPRWMMNNLGITNGNLVQVRRVALPRGTFLRLLPHNASFLQHANPKALLEWVLPHYVALTAGDIIQISFDDKDHILQVLEVSPGRAVCLTDSDISVDFAPPLNPSSSPPPTATTTTTPASPPVTGGSTLGTLAQGNGVEGVDYQTCTNCFAPVPKDRYTMHSLSCPRINWYCDKCKKVVQRSQKDEHLATVHAPAKCPLGCDAVLENSQVDEHVAKGLSFVLLSPFSFLPSPFFLLSFPLYISFHFLLPFSSFFSFSPSLPPFKSAPFGSVVMEFISHGDLQKKKFFSSPSPSLFLFLCANIRNRVPQKKQRM